MSIKFEELEKLTLDELKVKLSELETEKDKFLLTPKDKITDKSRKSQLKKDIARVLTKINQVK